MNRNNYSKLAKVFHWGFVILTIYGFVKQVEDIKQLKDLAFLRFEIIFALIFFLLLVIRFLYMKKTQVSSLPAQTPKIQKVTAKIVHNGMYLLLAGTALSGLLIGFLFWFDYENNLFISIAISFHEIIINLLYLFIAVHIVAATYHRLRKDGVWSSMVPFFKEKNFLKLN